MPRRRAFVPENTQAMWEFCRHCGAPFPPEETAVRGVCPDCAEARYEPCGNCGSQTPRGELRRRKATGGACARCARRS